MFSGIVEEMGVVKTFNRMLSGAKLSILASKVLQDLMVGESVSVSGVCLTVVEFGEQDFFVDVSPETLQVISLGHIAAGAPVNLERAMKLNERIGGHLVSGHVDGVGTIRGRQQAGDSIMVTIDASEDVLRYCVRKGSIAVDGVSLTINEVSDKSFSVMIIPYTAEVTTFGVKGIGDSGYLQSSGRSSADIFSSGIR